MQFTFDEPRILVLGETQSSVSLSFDPLLQWSVTFFFECVFVPIQRRQSLLLIWRVEIKPVQLLITRSFRRPFQRMHFPPLQCTASWARLEIDLMSFTYCQNYVTVPWLTRAVQLTSFTYFVYERQADCNSTHFKCMHLNILVMHDIIVNRSCTELTCTLGREGQGILQPYLTFIIYVILSKVGICVIPALTCSKWEFLNYN